LGLVQDDVVLLSQQTKMGHLREQQIMLFDHESSCLLGQLHPSSCKTHVGPPEWNRSQAPNNSMVEGFPWTASFCISHRPFYNRTVLMHLAQAKKFQGQLGKLCLVLPTVPTEATKKLGLRTSDKK